MMGDEPRAELGMSMEKRIFGGPFKLLPLDTALEYTQSSHPFKRPFAISQLDFPYSPEYGEGGFHINQEYNWPDPATSFQYLTPTVYAAHLQSEAYWRSIVARFGGQAIRMPRFWRTERCCITGMKRCYSTKKTKRFELIHNNFPQSESAEEIGETVKSFYSKALDDFDDRKRIYKALRPWYDAECNTTPNIPSPLPLGDKLTHRR